MEILSERQRQMLAFIRDYLAAHERPPANREIGQALGIASTGHVDYDLMVLAKMGYLEREAIRIQSYYELPRHAPGGREGIS
jgi:repressor LexA